MEENNVQFSTELDSEELRKALNEESKKIDAHLMRAAALLVDILQDVKPTTVECFQLYFKKAFEELAAGNQQSIFTLKSTVPQKHTIPNNALANSLQHGEIGAGEDAREGILKVGYKGKKEITSFVSVNYEPDASVSVKSTNYTEFDRQVQNAIVSLWHYGEESHIVTPSIVARAMSGKKEAEKISPQLLGAVTKSIEKQWRIFVEINATEEVTGHLKAKGTPPPEGTTFHWREHLLELQAVDVRNGKQKLTAYKLRDEPILSQYARMTGQILTVKSSLLDIKKIDKKTGKATTKSIANTCGRTAVRGYLLRRIETIKHAHKSALEAFRKHEERRKKDSSLQKKPLEKFMTQKPVILFDTLFAEAGLTSTEKGQMHEYRNYIFSVLDYWKSQNYIYGYSLQRKPAKGNPVTGIVVEFEK